MAGWPDRVVDVPLDPHAMVALLVDRGNALRAAGVMSLSIGEMSVTLAPPDIGGDPKAPAVTQDEPDALDDPDTFGTDALPSFDAAPSDEGSP